MLASTKEIFIQNLKHFRKQKFPKQADFAPLVGLTERGYQKYEQGESDPDTEIIDRFSEKLGIAPADLILPRQAPNTKDLPPMPHAEIGKQLGAPGYVAEPARPYEPTFTKADVKEIAIEVAKEIAREQAPELDRLRVELEAAKAELAALKSQAAAPGSSRDSEIVAKLKENFGEDGLELILAKSYLIPFADLALKAFDPKFAHYKLRSKASQPVAQQPSSHRHKKA